MSTIPEYNLFDLEDEPVNNIPNIPDGYDGIRFPLHFSQKSQLSRKYDLYMDFDPSTEFSQKIRSFDQLESYFIPLPFLAVVPTCILPWERLNVSTCQCKGVLLSNSARQGLTSLCNRTQILLDEETHTITTRGCLGSS